jgi:hypothetical protein
MKNLTAKPFSPAGGSHSGASGIMLAVLAVVLIFLKTGCSDNEKPIGLNSMVIPNRTELNLEYYDPADRNSPEMVLLAGILSGLKLFTSKEM